MTDKLLCAVPLPECPEECSQGISKLDDDSLRKILLNVRDFESKVAFGLVCKWFQRVQDATITSVICCWKGLPVVSRRFTNLRWLHIQPGNSLAETGFSEELNHVAIIQNLVMSCPLVNGLFFGSDSPADACLEVIATGWSELEELAISGPKVTKYGLDKIVCGCSNLRVLRVIGCWKVSTLGLLDNIKRLEKLEHIQLSPSRMRDIGLAQIGQLAPKLKKFVMISCRKIKGSGLPAFLLSCGHTLESLELGLVRGADDRAKAAFRSIAESCTILRKLRVTTWTKWDTEWLGYWDEELEAIVQKCSSLEVLELDDVLTDRGLQSIGRWCSNLKVLQIHFNNAITDQGLLSLVDCNQLRHIDIDGCVKITDSGVIQLLQAQRELEVARLRLTSISNLTLVGLGMLTPKLRICVLDYTDITDLGLGGLVSGPTGCRLLQELSVTGCHVTTLGLAFVIEGCPGLKSLSAAGTDISDALLFRLANNSKKLEDLTVSSPQVTDFGLKLLIDGCPELSVLKLAGCSVTAEALALVPSNCMVIME